ncbi:unnamed protein product [Linum tenue]|uniref:Uncharacterized protein n=1 Tax=Linum tenue TaxID=586396 RepID=A0AAV0NKN9_9ROSI|nr:unnamed protein product [Linum tenue]
MAILKAEESSAAAVAKSSTGDTMEQTIISRPLANFSPSVWGYRFASLSSSPTEMEFYRRQVEQAKAKVGKMLAASAADGPFRNVELINLLERLGVSYHFQAQIEDQLRLIFQQSLSDVTERRNDLYSVSLVFRVLRQHGYRVPCDVFDEFKDVKTGEFKECVRGDVRGILSLYEASHLRLHGEPILEEALAFSRHQLEEYSSSSSSTKPHLAAHIENALICPFHKSARRIDSWRFISFYADEEESRVDETLLRFAKLDFNFVQLMHQNELAFVSRWWRDTGLQEKLLYARDRIVELYFWATGSHYEPHKVVSRVAATKFAKMVSLVDDTYDAYAIEQLPDDMQFLFRAFLRLCDEMEQDMEKEGRCYSAHHAKDAFKELARAYDTEAKWLANRYTPTVKEFMANGIPSSSYGVISAAYFIGMGEAMGTEEYEWLKTNPAIDTAAKLLGRLLNDIMSHEDEQKRGHCPSAVECYKKEHGASDEEAVEAIKKMCDDAWKDLNEECMRPTPVGMPVIQHFLDLVRIITFIYIRNDSYTHSGSLKDHITSILLDSIPI